jgi:hypothetical protein
MIRVSKKITINGVEVTMLFTPRLFVMAEEKGIKLVVNTADMMQTMAGYADMCYCAALNYWTMDNDINDFRLSRADFHVWSASNQDEFGKTMIMAAEAITGKTMTELVKEQKAVKESNEVKKKKKSSLIMRLLRRS